MDLLQQILVYLALGAALFYLAWKFILPASVKKSKKASSGNCDTDCNCH